MQLHEVRFRSLGALSHAFESVHTCPSVEVCLVDRLQLSLQFRAAPRALPGLIEEVRAAGGKLTGVRGCLASLTSAGQGGESAVGHAPAPTMPAPKG